MFGLWPSRLATTWAGYFSTTSHSKLARRFWKSRGQGWQPARRITFSNCGTEIRPSSPSGCHRHHERPCIGTVKSVVQLGAEFRDDRHHANSMFPPVVFRFRTPHHEPALLPVHIPPTSGLRLPTDTGARPAGRAEEQFRRLIRSRVLEPVSDTP
jgi:hypothetical protein